jgi:hypothetical protein
MSQYKEDAEATWQRVAQVQDEAAAALEMLRIAHAVVARGVKWSDATQALVKEYFGDQKITLQAFETAYNLPDSKLRNWLDASTSETVREHNADLKSLSHEQLQQKARQEQLVKDANKARPVVPQIALGTPILPAFVTKRWLKEVSMDTVKSLRIKFDRQNGAGYFNRALEWRTSGSDAQELNRLSNAHLSSLEE